MKLLALLVLLSALTSLAVMEVVQSFTKICPQFFFKNQVPTSPKWGHQKHICQRWKNRYQYATLYDIKLRIPVYSAYTFSGYKKTTEEDYWKNEPQLDNRTNREMECIRDNNILQTLINQAIDADYSNSDYTRGHVFPNQYAADQNQSDSTCTFTNLAPQTGTSNREWGEKVEIPMRREINNICSLSDKTPAYIVTGVVPGERWIEIQRGTKTYPQGVNIPSYYWSAFCCINVGGTRVSRAYIAQQNEAKNPPAVKMTVNDLNNRLSTLYNTKNYSVFGNEC